MSHKITLRMATVISGAILSLVSTTSAYADCIPDGSFVPPVGALSCSCTHDGCSDSTSSCSCEMPATPTPTETSQSSNPSCIADGTFVPPANAVPGSCSCTHDGCSSTTSMCTCQTQTTSTTGTSTSGSYTFTVDGKTGRIDSDGKTYDSNGVYQGNFDFSTGIYTDNNGTKINVNNTPNVRVYNNSGVEVPKTPTTTSAGSTALQQDFQTYWTNVPTGTVVTAGGGTVTRNADGTATYRNGNYSYTYSSSTPLDEVAKNAPMLGQEWARAYGYTLPAEVTSTDFTDFESFKVWEKKLQLNAKFAANYQTPDYIHMMGLSATGDEEAFKRYMFFKSNPQYAEDYERIHQGQLSRYETDMTTIIKTDLTTLPAEYAEYYKNNPADLRAAEGFGFDPVLARKVYTGEIKLPYGVNATTWLQTHKWTANGVIVNDNRVSSNNNPYIGINGQGGGNYVQLKYDTTTGTLVGLDGTLYDPVTGEVKGKVDSSKFYGSGATTSQGATTSTSGNQTSRSTGTSTNNTTSISTNSSNTSTISIDYGNSYGLLLSESTANRLKIFTVKLVNKKSQYSSDTEYLAFLGKLSTKLSTLESSQKYANNATIKNSIQYLLLEIGKIRAEVSNGTTTTTLTDSQFITQAYIDVVKRSPDTGGLAYWSGILSSGQKTRDVFYVTIACAAKGGPAGNDKTNATTWLTQNGKTCGN